MDMYKMSKNNLLVNLSQLHFRYLHKDDLSHDPLKVLWYGRFHPGLNHLWTSILGPINILICCLFIALAIIGVLISYNDDIFFMAECLQTCILLTHAVVIFVVLCIHKQKIFDLLQQKLQFWKTNDFEGEVHETCSKISFVVKRIFRCYFYLNISVCILFDLQPLVTGYLPTTCYVPPGWFNILTVTLWYLSCVFVLVLPATDSFFCSLASSLIIQFKLLGHKFKTMEFDNNNPNAKLWHELSQLINYHDFLLRYCRQLNTTFRSIFMAQFLASIASAAVSVFIFVQPGPWVNRIKFLLYFVAITVETSFYCIPLEFVTNEANHLGDFLYESKWYELRDMQLKKSLTVIITRTQKTVTFSAYELVSMNLRTFVLMCKTVFSFYTYLNSAKSL